MQDLPFVKMHGCGNDYVYVDCFTQPLTVDPADLARVLSPRHTGVGGDGLIVLLPPQSSSHHGRMRMFNADGSESEMCGNGLRCLARLARDRGHIADDHMVIATGAGELAVTCQRDASGTIATVTVDMGQPRLSPDLVPVHHPGPGPLLPVDVDLPGLGRTRFLAVGMGNPHAVCFVSDPEAIDLATVGPLVEHHSAFPQRTNVEFVGVLPASEGTAGMPRLRQRTWERGSGITMACGTGACAVTVAAILDGKIAGRRAQIDLDGGSVTVHWDSPTSGVFLHGDANYVFSGVFSLQHLQ